MQGYELAKSVRTERSKYPDKIFIKWWRNEEDWIDFDLVARFLDTVDFGTDISGFSLIDQEEMWQVIEERAKGRATRVDRGDGNYVILYSPPEKAEMVERLPEYPYTPETLVKILDAETDFNYVD
ncbi:hypothetical protein L4X63_04910 [Geomonas sp. Red32]|uniref:hypothetical protein n=1 Tax=Geomonas sp. Red32 TaxID=2912856 RepID=UPI00202CD071|nr:hypothetical protein [Geomonas sp. Red32]MCM0080924.1 hypothetical protein [Geomonas sp. Red32]